MARLRFDLAMNPHVGCVPYSASWPKTKHPILISYTRKLTPKLKLINWNELSSLF